MIRPLDGERLRRRSRRLLKEMKKRVLRAWALGVLKDVDLSKRRGKCWRGRD